MAVLALLIHGDADPLVRYGGGPGLIPNGAPYPCAPAAAAFWAQRAGCAAPTRGAPIDLDRGLGEGDTEVLAWSCGVQLWTVRGAEHRIRRSGELPRRLAGFFGAQGLTRP